MLKLQMLKRGVAKLHRDDRGAMMLMSVFMALIMVAMLYYVAAIGESVVYRERLQDGADGTAFAGAAIMARSMNLVVIMNLAMAAIFASAVIANAVYYIIVLAQAAADAACVFGGSGCAAALCLFGNICDAEDDYDKVVREVQRATRLADDVQDHMVRHAQTIAIGGATEVALGFGDPVSVGTALGEDLPVVDDTDRRRMCEKTTDGQKITIEGIALFQAASIACNKGKPFVVAGLITAGFLGPICREAHDDVRPRAARVTADLGSRSYQFFGGILGGEPPITDNDNRVGVARWNTTGSSAVDDLGLRNVTRFALAQAEYYHGSAEPRDEIPWTVQWRARLRRFDVTAAGGGACSAPYISDICSLAGQAVVH